MQNLHHGGSTGLEEIEMGATRIQVDDKRIINCRADLNQLVPFKYEWAWKKYLDACANIGCRKKLICRLIWPCGKALTV